MNEARGASVWREWKPLADWTRVLTVDAHAEGEPLRVILAGFPLPPEGTILDRRRYARAKLDSLRTALMWEPRGHADMYGCILTPPVSPDAHFGVLFTHNEGYSTMCGHGIIAVTTVVLELGLFEAAAPVTELRIDTPAGLVTACAHVRDGRAARVSFRNVPSFVIDLDATVKVPGLGIVRYDLAFGGAFYAYVQAKPLGLDLNPSNARSLIDVGMSIKRAVMATRSIEHPVHADLGFLYGTIFIGPAQSPDSHSRNVCIFAEGEVDRSPTGTGVSARVAIHHARGEIARDQPIVIESIIGSRFTGRVVGETTVGSFAAVIPEVEGRAWITGRHEFVIDPSDPLAGGFLVR
ncbi:MAG: proline racemase family protein [Longimicrobiales bacterium]